MTKYYSSDRIINYARKKAIKAAHFPEILKKDYKISVLKSGQLILTEKRKRKK